MTEESRKPSLDPVPVAVEQVTKAHRRLLALRDEMDRHPELERAIMELELALNALTIKTGGLL